MMYCRLEESVYKMHKFSPKLFHMFLPLQVFFTNKEVI